MRGADIRFQVDGSSGTLNCLGRQTALTPEPGGHVKLRLLLDRTSLEVFGGEGQASLTSCFLPAPAGAGLSVYAEGGPVTLASLSVHPLHSAWNAPGQSTP